MAVQRSGREALWWSTSECHFYTRAYWLSGTVVKLLYGKVVVKHSGGVASLLTGVLAFWRSVTKLLCGKEEEHHKKCT